MTFSFVQSVMGNAVHMCLVKQIYELNYLVLLN